MEQLLRILKELRPGVDFERETKLIDDHVLDSFDILSVISELNAEFNVSIGVDDLTPENFNSAEAMMHLIEKLSGED